MAITDEAAAFDRLRAAATGGADQTGPAAQGAGRSMVRTGNHPRRGHPKQQRDLPHGGRTQPPHPPRLRRDLGSRPQVPVEYLREPAHRTDRSALTGADGAR